MFKQFAVVCVLSLPGLTLVPANARADALLSIAGPADGITPGHSFTVDVDIASAIGVYGYQFDVLFDPTAFRAVSSSEGSFLTQEGTTFFIPGTNDNLVGTVFATADTLVGAVPGVNGSGSLASFTFMALKSGTSELSLSGVQLIDASFSSLGSSSTRGSVTVAAGHVSAPEIHAAGATSAATLLLAGLFVLSSRRRRLDRKG